jgi:hypothetical protein
MRTIESQKLRTLEPKKMKTIQHRSNSRQGNSKTRKNDQNTSSTLIDPKHGETLAQRLLLDLAKKYKSMGEKKDLQIGGKAQ